MSTAPRDVRFMVAAKSMRRPVLKQLFEGGKSIPVERAADLAKPEMALFTSKTPLPSSEKVPNLLRNSLSEIVLK